MPDDTTNVKTPDQTNIPEIPDDIKGILDKYKDPVELAKAYKGKSKELTDKLHEYTPPKEYTFSDEAKQYIDENTLNDLTKLGLESGYTQKQLDALVGTLTAKNKEILSRIDEVKSKLPSSEEIDSLKLHFKNAISPEIIDNLIKNGDVDSLNNLKAKKSADLTDPKHSTYTGDKVNKTSIDNEQTELDTLNKKLSSLISRERTVMSANDRAKLKDEIVSTAELIRDKEERVKFISHERRKTELLKGVVL